MIGQVLEGVQPLPDEARIPALAEAMTAFMEAWMEHILKQKIKFRLVDVFVWQQKIFCYLVFCTFCSDTRVLTQFCAYPNCSQSAIFKRNSRTS